MNKTLLGCLMGLLGLASTSSAWASWGDVNGDSRVDIVDAMQIARYSVDLPTYPFYSWWADVTGDGKIDITDALLVAQYSVNKISHFPVEWNLRFPLNQWSVSTQYLGNYINNALTGLHAGVDLPIPVGNPVFSIEDGTVVQARDIGGLWGKVVIVEHAWVPSSQSPTKRAKVYAVYGHLSDIDKLVSVGQNVSRGQELGKTGTAGSGAHLHFQLDRDMGETTKTLPYWPAGDKCVYPGPCTGKSAAEQQDVITHTWDPMNTILSNSTIEGVLVL
jgi:murein DD-endopeptidase MepM/ murein hydrolase activator NlpD